MSYVANLTAGGPEKLLIVLPTYCEAGNIEQLLEQIGSSVPYAHVLVVDDNSPDGTADRALEAGKRHNLETKVISRDHKAGVGSALKVGMKYAVDNGYNWVVQMDADLSHDPRMIPIFLLAAAESDIVIGSRLIAESTVEGRSRWREYITKTASWIGRFTLGLKIQDVSSGFRCLRVGAVERMRPWNFGSDNFSFQMELNFVASRLDLRVVEVPITFTERIHGKSKGNLREVMVSCRDVTRLCWCYRRRIGHKPGERLFTGPSASVETED